LDVARLLDADEIGSTVALNVPAPLRQAPYWVALKERDAGCEKAIFTRSA
jgi:hypothetical protein